MPNSKDTTEYISVVSSIIYPFLFYPYLQNKEYTMIICTAKRRCVTGVTEYYYYRGDTPIGTAFAFIIPGFPVQIQSGALNLHCKLQSESADYPGHRLSLVCEESHNPYAELIRLSFDEYAFRLCSETIQIISRNDIRFYHNSTLLAVLESTPGSMDDDWELRLTLKAQLPLTDTLLTLLLSFPLIRI